jgi:3-methyl-2-oxobutanoate hydroxymethyltransferase
VKGKGFIMKKTVKTFQEMKERGEKISQLTCYDYSTAKIFDKAGIDMILVGDSLGMTMQGYSDTLPVSVEEMIVYGRSVARACESAFVTVDMPFMSYQVSVEDALRNAGEIMKRTGANSVKLEGGKDVCPQIRAITNAGIPVVAHIGMTPQSVNAMGGFKVQGKGGESAKRVLEDALAVQEAGAFAVTLECVPPQLAKLITEKLDIITIGIGAGNSCDGQVLVWQDMMGLTERAPKFVQRFAEIGQTMRASVEAYCKAVKEGSFPSEEHSYVKSDCPKEVYDELRKAY